MSAVGSTVQGMPVVASLRRAWPAAHIAWIIQPGPETLMRGRPDVDEFILFHRERGARAYADFRRTIRDRRFDVVIDLQPVFKGALVTRLIRAPIRLGYDRTRATDLSWLATNRRIPSRPLAHVQDELFQFLDVLGVEVHREWDFHLTETERREQTAWRESIERPVLAVITRSSLRARNWTLDGYARVIDIARHDLGLDPILLGGDWEGELADAQRLGELCAVEPRSALGGSLRQLAWRLDASDIVLSPDTGPLHMAVALDTPTIGLYGHTDPKRSGPYGRFADLTIDRYSRPGETGASRAARRGNMVKIEVEDVVEKLELAMRRYGEARS